MGTNSSKSPKEKLVRLQPNIRPVEYCVIIKPYFSTFQFDGEVDIKIEVSTSTLQRHGSSFF